MAAHPCSPACRAACRQASSLRSMPQHDILHQCARAVALASEPDETRRRSWTRLASSKLGAVDPNTAPLSASGGDVARSTLQDFIASAAALDAVTSATHLFRRRVPHRILGRHARHQWLRLERHLALGMLAACSKLCRMPKTPPALNAPPPPRWPKWAARKSRRGCALVN